MYLRALLVETLMGLLSPYAWFRKWWGGHWELWYVDIPVGQEMWFQVRECTLPSLPRPTGLCRGTPICEKWDEPPPGQRYSGPPPLVGGGEQPIPHVRLACRHGCQKTWHPSMEGRGISPRTCNFHDLPYIYYVGCPKELSPPRAR